VFGGIILDGWWNLGYKIFWLVEFGEGPGLVCRMGAKILQICPRM